MKVKSIKEPQDASISFKNVQMFYCSNARPRLLFRVDDTDASIERIQYSVARYKDAYSSSEINLSTWFFYYGSSNFRISGSLNPVIFFGSVGPSSLIILILSYMALDLSRIFEYILLDRKIRILDPGILGLSGSRLLYETYIITVYFYLYNTVSPPQKHKSLMRVRALYTKL